MDPRIVTVFGATGFLGRRIVWRLHRRGCFVRIASRHPDRGRDLFGTDPRLEAIAGDIRDTRSVIDAVTGAYGVVNAISLYIERGTETFHLCTSTAPSGWQWKQIALGSNNSCTSRESVLTLNQRQPIFVAAGKGNWSSAQPTPAPY